LAAQSEEAEGGEQLESVLIEAYSPLAHSEQCNVSTMPAELPLALMAKNYGRQISDFNLLQGQYKIKESRSHTGRQWLWVAGVAIFALLLSLGHKSAQLWQLNAEQDRIEQNIVASYKAAFPKQNGLEFQRSNHN